MRVPSASCPDARGRLDTRLRTVRADRVTLAADFVSEMSLHDIVIKVDATRMA